MRRSTSARTTSHTPISAKKSVGCTSRRSAPSEAVPTP